MRLWIVKLGQVTVSKPLSLPDAAAFADTLVDVQDSFCDVTIEFHSEDA